MMGATIMTRLLLLGAILLVSADQRANAQLREAEGKLGEDAAKAMEKKFSELEKWLKDAWNKPAPEIPVKAVVPGEKKNIRIVVEKTDSPEPLRKGPAEEKRPAEEQFDLEERIERCTVQVIVKAPFKAAARTGLGTAIEAYMRGETESQTVYSAESAAIERFKKEVDTTLNSPETRVVEALRCVLTNGVGTPVRDAFRRCAMTALVNGQTSTQAVHCFSQALLK
jgi:hypothetical protein